MLSVQELVCNYQKDAKGIQKDSPFSWSLESDKRSVLQIAYRIQVSLSYDFSHLLFDSQRQESEESVAISLSGFVFDEATQYHVRVMVWDNKGEQSPWSAPITIETAYGKNTWDAKYITADVHEGDKDTSDARLLRKEFFLDEKLVSAKAHVTSLRSMSSL